jgi:hypothetical protein
MRLGNYIYADACPFYQKELKHNTARLTLPTPKDVNQPRTWQVRVFHRVVRFVES